MTFSVNLLTTVAQCDKVIAAKQRERTGLVNRLNNLNFELANWGDVASLEAALDATQTFVTGLTPVVTAMPDGDEKLRQENVLNRYKTRLNDLTIKTDNFGIEALLEREQDRDEAEADIAVVDKLIAQVTARRAQL